MELSSGGISLLHQSNNQNKINMKKLLLLLITLSISLSSFAEKKVSSYFMSGVKRDISAYIDDNGKLKVIVCIMGQYDNDNVVLFITGEDKVALFKEKLKLLQEKYLEWSRVAKSNNVKDFAKKIDITFPNVEIGWKSSSQWYFSDERNFLNFIFSVSKTGVPLLSCYETAKNWKNEYIEQEFYIIFNSSTEIKSLINALDVKKIKSVLNANVNTDKLFQ